MADHRNSEIVDAIHSKKKNAEKYFGIFRFMSEDFQNLRENRVTCRAVENRIVNRQKCSASEGSSRIFG